MNPTKVSKTAFTAEPRRAYGQPLASIVSLRHVACSGITTVATSLNRRIPRAVRVGAVPGGSGSNEGPG